MVKDSIFFGCRLGASEKAVREFSDLQAWLLTLPEHEAVRSRALAALYRTIKERADTVASPNPSAPAHGAPVQETNLGEVSVARNHGEDGSELASSTRQEGDIREPMAGRGAAADGVQTNGNVAKLRRKSDAAGGNGGGAEVGDVGAQAEPGNKNAGCLAQKESGKADGNLVGPGGDTKCVNSGERGVGALVRRFGEKRRVEDAARQLGFDLMLVERVVAVRGTEERDYDTWRALVPLAAPAGEPTSNLRFLLQWMLQCEREK